MPLREHLPDRVLSALVDGEIRIPEVREARLHIARCDECRRRLREVEEIDSRVALASARSRPRPGLLPGLLGAVRAARAEGPPVERRGRRGVGLPAAAAAVLIVLAWMALRPPGDSAFRWGQAPGTAPEMAVDPGGVSPAGGVTPVEGTRADLPGAMAAAPDLEFRIRIPPGTTSPRSLEFVVRPIRARRTPPLPPSEGAREARSGEVPGDLAVARGASTAPGGPSPAPQLPPAGAWAFHFTLNPDRPDYVDDEGGGADSAPAEPVTLKSGEAIPWEALALKSHGSEDPRDTRGISLYFAFGAWN
jgi:anti-sigma factor RsiW